jgi:cytoskeletal protein CcmA (bactofilin family)
LGEGQGYESSGISSGEVMMFRNNSEKVESFIGAEADFQGEFVVKGTLIIAGHVDGRVKADCVILSESAFIKGEVIAPLIVVGGRFEGNLQAQGIVDIKSTGRVLGDIFANKFSVAEGGKINGKIEMKMHEGGGDGELFQKEDD